MWPTEDQWRAPLQGDFPPEWAVAWGDDCFGLWADLTVGNATQRMRWIEPSGPEGFWMGSTQQERDAIAQTDVREFAHRVEQEPFRVIVGEGFWLADTPCSQVLWEAVMGNNPSRYKQKADAKSCPVENVSWVDVCDHKKGFNARLAQFLGLDVGRVTLLKDEEWEYACRAGTRTAYWWGEHFELHRANVDESGQKIAGAPDGTSQVQRYIANPWGLYDMHGNIWEWCADVWQERTVFEAQPKKALTSDESRKVIRGGSWYDTPGAARAAFRTWGHCYKRDHRQGFRFTFRPPAQPDATKSTLNR
jgi:sulfatase modifying factor 1